MLPASIPTETAQTRYPFAGQDVPWLIRHWAQKTPDKAFIIWEPKEGDSRTWTYAQFWEAINRVANGLLARGLKKGDRLLIHSENCPEMVISWYASAIVGSIAVTTNTRCIGEELSYFAEHSGAVGCITQPQFVAELEKAAPQLNWFVVTDTDSGAPATQIHSHDGFASLLDNSPEAPLREAEPMLPVGIQYTSGTTSRPKAVVHTHANALWGGMCGSGNLGMDSSDTYICFLPFFHVNAQSWTFWSTAWVGGTVVLLPKFSASRFWELSLKHKITRSSVIPFVMKAIAAQEVPEHHYKTWSSGVVLPQVEQRFGVKTFATWGMTETVTHATRGILHHETPPGNIGKPSPGYQFAVINSETGELCKTDEIGDLYIKAQRGVQIFLEYFNNPEAMAKSFTEDGWFQTGDRVRLAADGFFYFADRDKDQLKVGAENVSAAQVEQCILAALGPGVVDEVAVVAQKHDMLDEVPVVFAVKSKWSQLSTDEIGEKITAACEAGLADFKRPRAIYWEEDLPRATLEKVAKNKLRELAEQYRQAAQ
jgi:crotonobetaine/carnitine-CoA ligase